MNQFSFYFTKTNYEMQGTDSVKKTLKKPVVLQTCHSALDAESYIYNNLEILACAGMTF